MASTDQKMMTTKWKCVADGVFEAEMNEFFSKVLAEEGYAGFSIRKGLQTELKIKSTRTREIIGDSGNRIQELQTMVTKRFKFPPSSVTLTLGQVFMRQLCAMAQAEALRYKLIRGLPVRRASYGVIRNIMESAAKGVEVVVSGKIRGQRAKAMKFKEGFLISTGEPKRDLIETAVRHVKMKQGMLGIRVSIMLDRDQAQPNAPAKPLPDTVKVHDPKPEMTLEQLEKMNNSLFERKSAPQMGDRGHGEQPRSYFNQDGSHRGYGGNQHRDNYGGPPREHRENMYNQPPRNDNQGYGGDHGPRQYGGGAPRE